MVISQGLLLLNSILKRVSLLFVYSVMPKQIAKLR